MLLVLGPFILRVEAQLQMFQQLGLVLHLLVAMVLEVKYQQQGSGPQAVLSSSTGGRFVFSWFGRYIRAGERTSSPVSSP